MWTNREFGSHPIRDDPLRRRARNQIIEHGVIYGRTACPMLYVVNFENEGIGSSIAAKDTSFKVSPLTYHQ